MASIGMCLGIVLGDYVSSDDNPYFANFRLLLRIISCLWSYNFTESDLKILEYNIKVHNSNHVILYPKTNGSSITPKLDVLIHFPEQIQNFVPPRYDWFRYESKNAPFKRVMRRNCNFHNVPWSLCTFHQKLVGLQICSDGEGDYFEMTNSLKTISMTDGPPIEVQFSQWSKELCDKTSLTLFPWFDI